MTTRNASVDNKIVIIRKLIARGAIRREEITMGIYDIAALLSILAGAVFMVYRSYRKKDAGHCGGGCCSEGQCDTKGKGEGTAGKV